jgi:hypothetical protein
MIVEFTNPVEAVRCAVEMQQSMAERNARTAIACGMSGACLQSADEEGMLERLKAHRREVIDPKITEPPSRH